MNLTTRNTTAACIYSQGYKGCCTLNCNLRTPAENRGRAQRYSIEIKEMTTRPSEDKLEMHLDAQVPPQLFEVKTPADPFGKSVGELAELFVTKLNRLADARFPKVITRLPKLRTKRVGQQLSVEMILPEGISIYSEQRALFEVLGFSRDLVRPITKKELSDLDISTTSTEAKGYLLSPMTPETPQNGAVRAADTKANKTEEFRRFHSIKETLEAGVMFGYFVEEVEVRPLDLSVSVSHVTTQKEIAEELNKVVLNWNTAEGLPSLFKFGAVGDHTVALIPVVKNRKLPYALRIETNKYDTVNFKWKQSEFLVSNENAMQPLPLLDLGKSKEKSGTIASPNDYPLLLVSPEQRSRVYFDPPPETEGEASEGGQFVNALGSLEKTGKLAWTQPLVISSDGNADISFSIMFKDRLGERLYLKENHLFFIILSVSHSCC